jgi:thioredoxin 1
VTRDDWILAVSRFTFHALIMDLLTRLIAAIALIGLGLLTYTAWNRWQLRRLSKAARRVPGLEHWQPGLPGVLYFTTPDCAPCRTVQRPALERLQAELGGRTQIVQVDASAQTAAADHWGVLSVPTTFVLDAAGAPRHVNRGVASAEKLKRQLVDSGWLTPGEGRPDPLRLAS